jgi:Alpha/beta hydrolase domain
MPVVTLVPGKPTLLLGAYDPATLGYQCQEFFVSGTARSHAAETEAEYTTRIVVLTPAEFNGTAIVEWLNVSGGIDAPAVWFMAHREIVRAGYAYVGVSAQRVGVEGGVSLLGNMSLKAVNPQRYSPLSHPGDAFSYDIYSQVGRLIRDQLHPEFVLAVGESQSAMFLTTYVNDVDPLARVYDGFLVHSRFGPAAPLDGGTVLEPEGAAKFPVTQFRPDLRVPLITVITETDLVGVVLPGYHLARQPDNQWLRTWEIPGTAHADNYTILVAPIDTGSTPRDDIVAAYAPTNMLMGQQLAHCINFAPQHHYVVQAAIAQLHNWVRTGRPAPAAPPMTLSETNPPRLVLDENGLARGGVRTPWVDVPIAKTSGVGSEESVMSTLFGSGEPFDAATLGRLYPGGAEDYVPRFTLAVDQAIEAGFIVPADRPEILELAAATYPRGT